MVALKESLRAEYWEQYLSKETQKALMRANLLQMVRHWAGCWAEMKVVPKAGKTAGWRASERVDCLVRRMAIQMVDLMVDYLVMQKVAHWALCLAGMMALMTDVQTNWGIHLAVMSASLKQKDAPRAARSAYWTMKDSSTAAHLAERRVAKLANRKLKDAPRARY